MSDATEVAQEITAPEAVQIDKQNEIVALYCQIKPGRNYEGNKLELPKAGEPNFDLKPGQYAKIKRSTAEWHLAKSRTLDQTNPLMLRILTLDQVAEMASKAAKKDPANALKLPTEEEKAAAAYREALEARAVKAGILVAGDEANKKMADKDLRELLGEPEPEPAT